MTLDSLPFTACCKTPVLDVWSETVRPLLRISTFHLKIQHIRHHGVSILIPTLTVLKFLLVERDPYNISNGPQLAALHSSKDPHLRTAHLRLNNAPNLRQNHSHPPTPAPLPSRPFPRTGPAATRSTLLASRSHSALLASKTHSCYLLSVAPSCGSNLSRFCVCAFRAWFCAVRNCETRLRPWPRSRHLLSAVPSLASKRSRAGVCSSRDCIIRSIACVCSRVCYASRAKISVRSSAACSICVRIALTSTGTFVEFRCSGVVGAVLGVLGREMLEVDEGVDELELESESESSSMDERGDGVVTAVLEVLGREKMEEGVDELESESESLSAWTMESSAWSLMLCWLFFC
jgi:hypothetical protein